MVWSLCGLLYGTHFGWNLRSWKSTSMAVYDFNFTPMVSRQMVNSLDILNISRPGCHPKCAHNEKQNVFFKNENELWRSKFLSNRCNKKQGFCKNSNYAFGFSLGREACRSFVEAGFWGCKSCSADLERTLIFAMSTVWMACKSSIVATQLMHGWSFMLTCDNFYNFICTQVACRTIYLLTGYGKEQRNSNW